MKERKKANYILSNSLLLLSGFVFFLGIWVDSIRWKLIFSSFTLFVFSMFIAEVIKDIHKKSK